MKTRIKVKGMVCGGCKAGVESAVKGLPGVKSAEASLEKAELTVEFDDKQSALADIKAAVVKAGFVAE